MNNSNEWWKTLFDDKYIETYVDINTQSNTLTQTQFILQSLNLTKKSEVLDLACGFGRHSLELSKFVKSILGVDYSKQFIDSASSKATELGINNCIFICKDMREIDFENSFDAVINMFTSFGYFEREEDNLLVIKNIYRALKHEGKLLLDLRNPDSIKTGEKIDALSNGLEVKSSSSIEDKVWTLKRSWVKDSEPFEYVSIIRLYKYNEIESLLKQVGFEVLKTYGDYSGNDFKEQTSPRLIIIAQKH